MNSETRTPKGSSANLLRVDNLAVFYERIQATWDVSFSVAENKVTALVGSNGAGKTAIMKALAGVLPHGGGGILFKGKDIGKMPPHRRVELGISLVPEGRKIFPLLSVEENLEIGAFNRRARPGRRKALGEIFDIFPVLAKKRNQVAGSLSGGEQQMLAIGRGLMAKPSLLMLDEPSLGLAPLVVKRVFEVIKQINSEGVTILLVEQNISQTLQNAHYAFVLETGRITLHGEGNKLLQNPHIKKAYLGL